jgi:hypothetical protein
LLSLSGIMESTTLMEKLVANWLQLANTVD